MGIDYRLLNHANATYYELGKGPFSSDDIWAMYEADIYIDILNEEWNYFSDDIDRQQYFRLLAKDLERFVKGTPENKLAIYGDSGDEIMWARMLGYKCIGSRYSLGNSEENQKCIDSENAITTPYSLSIKEREELISEG
jgi:hypothetical protein